MSEKVEFTNVNEHFERVFNDVFSSAVVMPPRNGAKPAVMLGSQNEVIIS
ncbi:MAG: hypothetical protein ACI93R_004261 [Flavobacteriales bacterium]|jgi:hypothetical protein